MDFVDFEAAKKRLGKSDAELQEMIKKGELRAFRDGGTWKFRPEDIDAKAGPKAGGADKDAGDTLMSIDADILFAEEEEVPADSAAETWIAADTEGVFPSGADRGMEEAMSAPESVPAPLALSPEADESSLGAVLSEEEMAGDMGGDEPVIAVDDSGMAGVVPSGSSATAPVGGPSRTRIVTLIEPPAHHGQFTFMLALSAIALGVGVYIVMAIMAGLLTEAGAAKPEFLVWLGSDVTPLVVMICGAVAVGVAAIIGYFLDKGRAAREAAGA
jgi:excisionase family DNA binding protein